MDKYNKVSEPEDLKEIIEKAYLKAKQEESDVDMNKGRKKIIAATVAASLVFMIGVNQSETFASYFDNIPLINKVVEFFKFDKGLEEAGKQGHIQIVEKSIKSNGIEAKVENIIYDNKRLAFKISYTSDENLEKLYLDKVNMEYSDGEKVNGHFVRISEIKGENDNKRYALVDVSFNNEQQLKGKSLNIAPQFTMIESDKSVSIDGNWKVKVPIDVQNVKKETKYFYINRKIRVEEMDVNLDSLRIFPTTARMDIIIDRDNSDYNFEGVAKAKLIDAEKNEYESTGAIGIKDIGDRTLVFESNYFVNSEKLSIMIEGIYVSKREESVFNIEIETEKMTVDSEYLFNINQIEKDENGKVKSFTISSSDSRISNENIDVIPFAFIEELKVGGVEIKEDMFERSAVYSSKEKGGQELRIEFKVPVKEDISFKLRGLKEYREVNKEIIIH